MDQKAIEELREKYIKNPPEGMTAKLVKNRKEGKIVYYSLDDEHVKHIFDQGLIHVTE